MMGADEKFVREHWEHVRSWVRDLDSYGTDQFNVALFLNTKDAKWCDNPFQGWQEDYGKEDAVWFAAAEFTRERLKDIAALELAIETAFCPDSENNHCATCELTMPIRKLAIAALAELKKGMKCL